MEVEELTNLENCGCSSGCSPDLGCSPEQGGCLHLSQEDEGQELSAAETSGGLQLQQFLDRQRAGLRLQLERVLEDHFQQLERDFVGGKGLARRLDSQPSRATLGDLHSSVVPSASKNSSRSRRDRDLDGQGSGPKVGKTPSENFRRAGSMTSFGTLQVKKRLTARHTLPTDFVVNRLPSPPGMPHFMQRLILSERFEWACAFLIISNAVFSGAEVQYQTSSDHRDFDGLFLVITKVYTGLFAIELLLRIGVDPKYFLCSRMWHWNLFDTLVVVASLGALVFPDVPHLSFLRIVRLTRMVRLLRVVQYLGIFTGLRILVSSVLNTMRSLAWTLFLLASILYVFGLLFAQTALDYYEDAEREPELAGTLRMHFGSLPRAVSTLFKCITGGIDWGEVALPLGQVHPAWELCFCVFISFTCLAVLNVVTGVFCQSAIESANRDKDGIVQNQLSMTEKYTAELKGLFRQMDHENNGVVTLTAFEDFLRDSNIKAYFDGLNMSCDDAWNLFKLLDTDESNSVDVEEFVQGCLKLQGAARSIDTHMLIYESRWAMKRLHEISADVKQIGTLIEEGGLVVGQSSEALACMGSEETERPTRHLLALSSMSL